MRIQHPFRTGARSLLLLAGLLGVYFSAVSSRQLNGLEQEHDRLTEMLGEVVVGDPSQVHISAVPPKADETMPGVTVAHVWRFNIYLPPNYGRCVVSRRGDIAADSPRSSGGSSSSSSSKHKESQEFQLSVSLLKTSRGWLLARTGGGGGGSSHLPKDFDASDLEELVVEPVVENGQGTRSFDPKEAICLIRIREKNATKPRKGYPDLYRGNALYLLESDQRQSFDDWAYGRTDGMAGENQ